MNLEEMITNPNRCDKCDAELEVDQIGLCGDCIDERTYTFSELSDKAKQHARQAHVEGDYPYDDWWDSVYEDAVQVGKILGITIGTRPVKLMNGKTRQEPDIQFSGFSSQGDGACFEGNYSYNPKAVDEIEAYCTDGKLIRIAKELNALQINERLQSRPFFTATIALLRGNYCHSNMMDATLDIDEDNDISGELVTENAAQELFRDFADWIYKSLEDTHDWLHSDECVDEALVDETFDEDGNTV